MNRIRSILKEYYSLDITDIMPQQGGWASLAYRLVANNQSYFLKVYEKDRASTPKLTSLINHYVPIMMWLSKNSNLKEKISVPLITNRGDYKCEDEYGIYLLYNYIEGETIGKQDLSDDQVRQLSEIITELHLFGEDIPVETDAIKEDFAIPFSQSLRQILNKESNDMPLDIWELLSSHTKQLANLLSAVEALSLQLEKSDIRMVLCHTDLHNWNLMQSGKQLMLIDWEGLKLAPPETDLMFLVDKPYFNEFLSIYERTHKEFEINPHALKFYQGRRKLEDIWEFLEQLLYDQQDEEERVVTMSYLRKELKELKL